MDSVTFAPSDSRLKASIKDYQASHCPALRELANKGIDIDAAQYLAKQYYPVSIPLPLFLAGTIARLTDETIRLILVGNLYEEHGNLDPTQTHPELFRRFIRSVNLNPEDIKLPPADSPSHHLLTYLNHVFSQGSLHQALATLYAFETLFQQASSLILEGLQRSNILPQEALLFFSVHACTDEHHANEMHHAITGIDPSSSEQLTQRKVLRE